MDWVGSALVRTVSTNWHAAFRLPTKIAEPKRITTFTYDASGYLLSKSVQATSDENGSQGFSAPAMGNARTWSYSYNQFGQMLTATGPRSDALDITTYAYYPSSNSSVMTSAVREAAIQPVPQKITIVGRQAASLSKSLTANAAPPTVSLSTNLLSVTNAAGQITTLSNYDGNGRPGLIVGPNGVSIAFTYNPRGWIESTSISSANGEPALATTYNYDYVGQLIGVIAPDGATLTYRYDAGHRLTDVADNQGNTIHYTLDNMGNRTVETVKDINLTLTRQTTRVFDALNRLNVITGGTQ